MNLTITETAEILGITRYEAVSGEERALLKLAKELS